MFINKTKSFYTIRSLKICKKKNMSTKNDSKFPVIIPRATLTIGAPSATF